MFFRNALAYNSGSKMVRGNHLSVWKTTMKPLLTLVAVIAFFGSTTIGHAGEAGAKSPELQVLDRYVGTWDETVVTKPALWTPEKTTSSTTTTRKWILNGRMMENKGAWTLEDEFLHLMTYDPKQNEFRQWYYGKDNLVPQEYQGRWDAPTQTFTFTGTLADGIQSTSQQHFVDKDTFTWTLVAKDQTGKVVLDMEGKCVRKK